MGTSGYSIPRRWKETTSIVDLPLESSKIAQVWRRVGNKRRQIPVSFLSNFCSISFDILRHSTRNTKTNKSDKVLLQIFKTISQSQSIREIIDHTFEGGGKQKFFSVFLTKNRKFINNEEHHGKIFIQKYLYNKVKIELHYSIARITRHVKFKARHVLILQKKEENKNKQLFPTKENKTMHTVSFPFLFFFNWC